MNGKYTGSLIGVFFKPYYVSQIIFLTGRINILYTVSIMNIMEMQRSFIMDSTAISLPFIILHELRGAKHVKTGVSRGAITYLW